MNVVNFIRPDPAESPDLKAFTSQKLDWINAVTADHTLGSSAVRVAICIMQHVNQHSKLADPSDPTIADKTALSVPTVERARKQLRAAGWITWQRRMLKTNVYKMLTEPMAAVSERQQTLTTARKDWREALFPAFPVPSPVIEPEQPSGHQDTPPDVPRSITHDGPVPSPVMDKHLSSNTQRKKERKEESHDLTVVDPIPSIHLVEKQDPPDFEKWWRQYPRRVGKLKAQLEYAKAIKKGATHQELWDGAIRYAGERMNQDPKFTKHPATWLSNGCWLDEPNVPTRSINRADSAIDGMRGYIDPIDDEICPAHIYRNVL